MYGQINRLTAAPGQRDTLTGLLRQGSADLPGCLSYIVAEDAGDADTVWITEVWEDAGHHAASLEIPAVKAAITQARPLIAGFERLAETRPLAPAP